MSWEDNDPAQLREDTRRLVEDVQRLRKLLGELHPEHEGLWCAYCQEVGRTPLPPKGDPQEKSSP